MAGIIVHIEAGSEKSTEIFSQDRLCVGSDDSCDLQIQTKEVPISGVWFELEDTDGVFRLTKFAPELTLTINEQPVRRYIAITDGDVMKIVGTAISFSFFAPSDKPSLIRTKRDLPHVAQFIESAALDAATSPKRDDAKAFLREFSRELMREISWTTKAIILVLSVGFITGVLYLGWAVSRELRENREQSIRQASIIEQLEKQLGVTNNQLGDLEKVNSDIIKTVSLAQNLRVDYGSGVCLIVGVYDLVDRSNGRVLRYPDPNALSPNSYEPTAPAEGESSQTPAPGAGLTSEGGGSTVEYDFIGTGFHVGGGYVITNKHVLQPWTEDDLVKQMMRDSNGRARVKRLVIYFPNVPQPFPLRVREYGGREDVAVATIDPMTLPADVAALPLDSESEASTIGKTVVTMGYPSGPDRLLAMVDDDEAKSINTRFGNSRQNLINFLAQSRKIVPLTTQGSITDLDARRIVHDARTAEGGSGAPLFGQTGKVIGVNFGVFTENTAANMAVPIRFAVELLKRAGWKSPEELKQQQEGQVAAAANTNAATTQDR
ncbi:MAG TPA: trypsin-like peptidase domain-containing protein [Pyrinomonadaceae bacterium]|nr:trypsin-like peptidase domain-containing protein [Pyrinomonadaceae bacterium]